MTPPLADTAAKLLATLPIRSPHAFGRPPAPAHAIGLEFVRLTLAIAANTGTLPWHTATTIPAPTNARTAKPTSGINTLAHLIMRAARPSLALVTGTAKQWRELGAEPLPNASIVPYVYYRSVPSSPGLAVPVRGELYDLTQVEFADTRAAHAFAERPRAAGAPPMPQTDDQVVRFEHVIDADPARQSRIAERFGKDAPTATHLIADLAAAFAAAGRHPHASVGDAAPALALLAERPEQLLWIAAEAQRLLTAATPAERPRPPVRRITHGRSPR